MKKNYQAGLFLYFLLPFSAGYAQDRKETSRTRELEEVIVRSGRQIKSDTLPSTLKIGGRLIELPQNLISIRSDLLKMQGAFEVQDALRNVSGIYTGGADGIGNIFSGIGDVSIRGFSGVTTFRNGLPASGAAVSQEDVALIEQVDFIKGPAGFVNTMGPAGGAINVNTKVPKTFAIADATLVYGRFNYFRAAIDLGTAIREKGFSFRFNAAYESQAYYVDYTQRRKLVVAPVVQYHFNRKTSLLAEWNMILGRSLYGSQFGKTETENRVQKDPWRANYLADPGLPVTRLDDQYGRLVFSHQLNADWKITSQSSVKHTPMDQWTIKAGNGGFGLPEFNDAGETSRSAFRYQRTYTTYNSQLFVNGRYQLSGRITHQVLAGFDLNSTRLLEYQSSGAGSFPFNRNHPQYGIQQDSLRVMDPQADHYHIRNQTAGGYLYNTFSWKAFLFLNLGARYSTNHNDRLILSRYTKDTADYKASSLNPRAGATYLINKRLAVYATYDQSFEPQAGVDDRGNVWKPLQSYNTEIGVKKDWFEGQLSTVFSAYRIIRNNAFSYDPIGQALRQVNQVRNKGIELDVIGSPTRNLTLTANYSFINSVYARDEYTPDLVGKRFAAVPRQQVNTWIMYAATFGPLKGWSFALGETAVIGRATDVTNVNLPDYIKFDGTVMYQRNRWYIRALLDNITNRRYITDGTVRDRYNSAYTQVIGQTWTYRESTPFNLKVQVGIRLK